MSTVTTGANASLKGPIRRALKELGYPTASPLSVTDSDLSAVLADVATTPAAVAWRVERLADLAVLQALRSVLGKTTEVDYQAGQDREYLSQFATSVRAEIAALEVVTSRPYGPDTLPAVVSPMTDAPMPNDPFNPCRSASRPGYWPYP
jgi:hypothetical protein